VVRIPFHLASRAVIHGRFRGAVRASGLYFLRTVTQYKMAQIQWLSPPTYWAYMFWMWWSGVTSHEPAPEVLVDGTRLYWLGPKRTDRVILYVPGMFFCPCCQCSGSRLIEHSLPIPLHITWFSRPDMCRRRLLGSHTIPLHPILELCTREARRERCQCWRCLPGLQYVT